MPIRLLLPRLAKAASWQLVLLLLLMAGNLIVHAPRAQAQVSSGQRLALVIGNAAYTSGPLTNPVNDARAMRTRLESLGFEVLFHENLKRDEIGSIYRQFRSKIVPGGVALVFYAGHGVQFKGENYFPAVDANIRDEEDVPLQSLNLGHLLSNMEEAKAGVSLVFLDACRDNPYARSFRSASRGLAKVPAASGMLIHYATKPGSVAADGDGQNGTYTEALLAQISNPGVPVEQMLKRVTNRVVEKSKGKQDPWVEGSLRGDFYFIFQGPTTVRVQNESVDPEVETWRAADSVGSTAAYQSYLKRYPQGRYIDAAAIKLEALQKPTAAPSGQFGVAPIVAPATGDPEAALWNEVKVSGARESLEGYLKQYPKGKYQVQAKLELKKLDDADKAQRARQEQAQKQAAEQARQEQLAAAQAARVQQQQAQQQAWDTAKAQDSPDAYASYLQNYPSGRYAAQAQAAQLKAQREATQREKQQAAERQKEALAAEQRAQQQAAEREAQALKAQQASQAAAAAAAANAMPASARYSTVGSYPITDCVKDKSTGLTWEGKPASGERASDKVYTNHGDKRSGDASAYADSVNAMRLCGYSDWRLPTKDELEGLVVKGVRPTIDGTWFPNTQASRYWSSSPYGYWAGLAWYVLFLNGYANYDYRNDDYHVRLVR